jgi:hypothetical protein
MTGGPRLMQLGDAELVALARAGDREMFGALFERHRPMVVRLCKRVGSPELAEDAAQEAAVSALLSLERLQDPARFGPWLAGIALNVCRRWRRERSPGCWSWEAIVGGTQGEPAVFSDDPSDAVEVASSHAAPCRAARRPCPTPPLRRPLLLVLVFLMGTLWTPFYAAQATIIPELLGEDEPVVARGNAILQGAYRSTYWLGPLAAGFFIAAFEAPVVLFIDAATFLVGAALLTGVPAARAPVEAEHANDILAGVRFIARTPLLRSITSAQELSQASFQSLILALPVLAFVRYGQDPKVAGVLDGAWGAGALVGSWSPSPSSHVATPLSSRQSPLLPGSHPLCHGSSTRTQGAAETR